MCVFIVLLIFSGWLQSKIISRFVKMDNLAVEKAANVTKQIFDLKINENKFCLDRWSSDKKYSYSCSFKRRA